MILVYPKPRLPEIEQYSIRLDGISQRRAAAVSFPKAYFLLDKPQELRRPPPYLLHDTNN